jgi:DNA-binding NarL/FixJ family response regulator
MQTCRILLVDAHPLLLDILNRFLGEISEIEIVARARDGLEAMSLAILHQPDLVVTNLALPGLGGRELTRRLAAEPRAPRIVLMSFHDETAYREAADAAGADGFVLKKDLGTKLIPLIQSLMKQ